MASGGFESHYPVKTTKDGAGDEVGRTTLQSSDLSKRDVINNLSQMDGVERSM